MGQAVGSGYRGIPRTGWRGAALRFLVLFSLLAPQPAAAIEIFGLKIFEGDEVESEIENPVTYTTTFRFRGPSGRKDDVIEGRVRDASRLIGDEGDAVPGTTGLLAKANNDYTNILATLYRRAYYNGVISIRINGQEAADISPLQRMPSKVSIVIDVQSGETFRFGTARVINPAPTRVTPDDEVEKPEELDFRPGARAYSDIIPAVGAYNVELWRQQGHAKAEVVEEEVLAFHPEERLDVTIGIQPGPRMVFGPVTSSGTTRVDRDFIIYMAGLEPGEEFDPDLIKRASDRLSRLGVFSAVQIQEPDTNSNVQPINIEVEDRKPRRIGFGGSVSSIDGIGLEAYWLHRNLFGRAERLRFDFIIKDLKAEDLQLEEGLGTFSYLFQGTFTKPGIINPDTDLELIARAQQEDLENYRERSVEFSAGLNYVRDERVRGRLSVFGNRARFEDDLGTRDFSTFGLIGGLTLDERDDFQDPREGYFIDVEAKPFYEFSFDNQSVRTTVEGRGYYGFGESKNWVLAGRLKLGTVPGASLAETSPDNLFFAGGGGSVRGYPFQGIGVDVPGVGTLGGRSLVEGSAELRVRRNSPFGLAAFVDAAHVGADVVPTFDEDVYFGAGAGVRYFTSVGVLRLDLAAPLNRRDGDPKYGVYIGIGQAF
ncbi:autotransporter assembly complex protein TamA [Oceanomicrobium pacificus]|uniref:BamA/TamA family outer membrane protein n=1 Tax=Oceanomicrobium pacificus TaxID=2692916 RepID=A0A6B0TZS2_9RHOB|nr:autotransporter assembly complex family protein [Oceanomicrobium pacificus]MXU66503.1 BamA/TamA family outer membrane protein [Oceanomicrobium pacificus]